MTLSLSSVRGVSLCVVGIGSLGRGEKSGDDGRRKRETEKERLPLLPSSHHPPLACYFSIIAIFIGIPSGSVSTEKTVTLSIPIAKIDTLLYQSPALSNWNPVVAVGNFSLNSWRLLRRHRMACVCWRTNNWLLSEDYIHVYEVSSWAGCYFINRHLFAYRFLN